jgi:hypothetical protein
MGRSYGEPEKKPHTWRTRNTKDKKREPHSSKPGPRARPQIPTRAHSARPRSHLAGTCQGEEGVRTRIVKASPNPNTKAYAIVRYNAVRPYLNRPSDRPRTAHATDPGRTCAATNPSLVAEQLPLPEEDAAAVAAALKPQGEARFANPARAAAPIAMRARASGSLRLDMIPAEAPASKTIGMKAVVFLLGATTSLTAPGPTPD